MPRKTRRIVRKRELKMPYQRVGYARGTSIVALNPYQDVYLRGPYMGRGVLDVAKRAGTYLLGKAGAVKDYVKDNRILSLGGYSLAEALDKAGVNRRYTRPIDKAAAWLEHRGFGRRTMRYRR